MKVLSTKKARSQEFQLSVEAIYGNVATTMETEEKELMIEQLMKVMQEQFVHLTLEELRSNALEQASRTAHTSLQLAENDRLFLVACFARPEAVRHVCQHYGLPDTCTCQSWDGALIVNALYDAAKDESGQCVAGLGNDKNELIAVAVIAAKKASVAVLQECLNIA